MTRTRIATPLSVSPSKTQSVRPTANGLGEAPECTRGHRFRAAEGSPELPLD